MPSVTIDGRGSTPREAVQDMWKRMQPLTQKGYNPITEVELVDAKTKKVLDHFLVTDPEFLQHVQGDEKQPAAPPKGKREDHKPPAPHEYPFFARVTLEG